MYKKIGVDGIKTGYLAVEKYSLASTMKKDTRRIIAVGTSFLRNSLEVQVLKAIKLGFRNTNTYEISKKGDTFELDTWLGTKNKVKAVTKDDFYITLNKKDVRNLKISLEYKVY